IVSSISLLTYCPRNIRVNGESDGGSKDECVIVVGGAVLPETARFPLPPPVLLLSFVQSETMALRCSPCTTDVTGVWPKRAQQCIHGSIRRTVDDRRVWHERIPHPH